MKEILNKILLSLLGSEDLVQKWWTSPNLYFEGKTPNEVYKKDPHSVRDYICRFYDR